MTIKFPKRIELRLDLETYDKVERYRINKNLEDKQDAIRKILTNNFNNNSFFQKLKQLFIK